MPIVISNNLVLAETPALNANNPVVGWRNLVTPASVVADTEDVAFPTINLANPATHLIWKSANTSQQNITVTVSQIDPVDYLAVAGHNFGSAGIAVSIRRPLETVHPVPLPSGIVAGELLLILVAIDNSAGATTVTTPVGWTELYNVAGPGNLRRHAAYYKTATGNEGASVQITASIASEWISNAYRISGQLAPPEAATATGSATDPDPPNLAPTWGAQATLWIAAAAAQAATLSAPTPPANYGEQVNAFNQFDVANFSRMTSARRELTALSENPGAFTGGTVGNWVAATIAVRVGAGPVKATRADNMDLAQAVIPADDSPLLFRFVPQSLTGVRLRMVPSAVIPQAAVLYVGKLLVLQRRIYVGHRILPYNRRANIVTGTSEEGQFLGRIVLGEMTESALDLKNITPAFFRSDVEPWLKEAVTRPWFFAWRPGDYPLETGYCWAAGDVQVSNQRSNGMMQAGLNLQGIVA